MTRRSIATLACLVGVACGPQVNVAGDASDGSETSGPIDTSTTGRTSRSTTARPDTSAAPSSTAVDGATFWADTTTSGADDDRDDGPVISFTGDGCGIDPPEGASLHCPPFECDPFEQDCRVFEKCMPWANDGGPDWNAHRCTPLDPTPAQLGETCHVEASAVSGVDDCDLGLMCLHVDPDTLEGVCVALCAGTQAQPTCEGETQCMFRYDGAITICVDTCDPVANDCPLGDCIPIDAGITGPVGFGCFVDSAQAMPGETCDRPGGCAAGSTCNFGSPECPDAIGCCASYCDLDAADPSAPCMPGQVCTQIFGREDADPEIAHFGLCMAP